MATVRDVDDVRNDPRNGKNDPDDVKNDVRNDPDDVRNDVRNEPNDVTNLSARQQWILDELRAKSEMRKGEVFRSYQKQFRRSKSVIWRAYVAAT